MLFAATMALVAAGCQNTDPAPPDNRDLTLRTVPPVHAPATKLQAEEKPASPPADKPVPQRASNVTRIGLLLPLSGPRAQLGQSLLDAALMALFDVPNERLQLLPFDTRGNAAGGAKAAALAVEAGVDLVIGPVFSNVATSVAPTVLAARLNMISLSNDSAIAKPGVLLAGLLPETQISRVVDYAVSQGRRRFAALLPRGPFGERVDQALRDTLRRHGLTLVRTIVFDHRPGGIASAVRALSGGAPAGGPSSDSEPPVEPAFDSLLLAASGPELARIGSHLGNFDVDTWNIQILGLAEWAQENPVFEPTLVGAWYAARPGLASSSFLSDYRSTFGVEPTSLGIVAYDLVAMASLLAVNNGNLSLDTLTNQNGFSGVGGVFRFHGTGLPEQLLEVRQIEARSSSMIDPGGRDFLPLSN